MDSDVESATGALAKFGKNARGGLTGLVSRDEVGRAGARRSSEALREGLEARLGLGPKNFIGAVLKRGVDRLENWPNVFVVPQVQHLHVASLDVPRGNKLG
jgi:hypothetical protein